MLKALKDLLVAMINATLILIVLALFLAWKVTSTADQIASNFATSLISVEPLREDIQGLTAELGAIRTDLQQLGEKPGELSSASLQRIENRLNQMQARADSAREAISNLSQAPTRMVDYAIDSSIDRLEQGIMEIRGCVPQAGA